MIAALASRPNFQAGSCQELDAAFHGQKSTNRDRPGSRVYQRRSEGRRENIRAPSRGALAVVSKNHIKLGAADCLPE